MKKINVLVAKSSGGVYSVVQKLVQSMTKNKINLELLSFDNKVISSVSMFFHIIKSHKRNSNDECFILMHFSAIFIGFFLHLCGFRNLIIVFHTDLVGYYKTSNVLKRSIIRLVLFVFNRNPIVFVSKESMKRSTQFFNITNAHYIYNIHDTKQNEVLKHGKSLISNKCVTFGVVSRLHKDKNIDFIILLIRHLNLLGVRVKLLIFGEGPEKSALTDYVSKLECSGCVSFIGHSNDRESIYNSFDALISMSRLEGLPTVILEAFEYRVPVFFSDCHSGPRELLLPTTPLLRKTASFDVSRRGFLVRPLTPLRPAYSMKLESNTFDYVDYLLEFIERLNTKGFGDFELSQEFDSEYVVNRWLTLIDRVSGDS